MAANSIPGAFDAYSDAMSLDPANREALQAVSQLGLQTGHLRESLEATEAILSLSPDEPGALLIRGLHAIVRSRLAEADGYADRILARNPGDEGGVILKARIAVRRGAPQEALAVLADYDAVRADTAAVAMTRLEIYRVMRDAAGMREQFARLRKLAPDNSDLRLDEADFAFKDKRPRDGRALIVALLADPKTGADQIAATLGIWREYAAEGPDDASLAPIAATGSTAARLATAELLARQERTAAARRLLAGLDAATRMAHDALFAAREGRPDEALRLADKVLARDETHCLALTVRADSLLQQGKPDAALRPAQFAASQCPTQVEAWMLAATAYARRADMENARRIWRQGISANPQNLVISGAYAAWLSSDGKDREALAVARRLTREAPALLGGWRLYRDMCARLRQDCLRDAETGLANAATIYGIDLPPGQAPPNGLFGRIIARDDG
jgi:tetratricopeptide (TPR) repeat protein